MPRDRRALIERLAASGNDLEPPAIALRPEIGTVRAAIQLLSGCRMARMSGSGATCFGLFDHAGAAEAAARQLQRERPSWWVKASRLGGHTAGNTHSDEPPAPR
jgi:4-diphosphocytidyl-2-C-methyl-D-erythritol kinase